MVVKPYSETFSLTIFRCLMPRMDLSELEKQQCLSLERGDEGEKKFAVFLEDLPDEWLILHDLLLVYKNNLFQIDTLLLSPETLYVLDVKNFEGDYYIDFNGIWRTKSGKEIKNPILQLERCVSLFRQFLDQYNLNIPIKEYVIFINPEFNLYQAPLNLPAIFPTQLNRFLKYLRSLSFRPSKKINMLANQLKSAHLLESPYNPLPEYSFEQLRKGITCHLCNSLSTFLKKRQVICNHCRHEENVDEAVLRNIHEFQLLFPKTKLTTNIIFQWCNIISKKTIRRILGKHFILQGRNNHAYYINP